MIRYKSLHLHSSGLLAATKKSIEEKYFEPAAGWLADMVDQREPQIPDVQLSPTSRLVKEMRRNREYLRIESKMELEMSKYETFSMHSLEGC